MNQTYLRMMKKRGISFIHTVQCNRTKTEIAEKCQSKYCVVRPLLSGISGTTVPISEFMQTFTGRSCWVKVFLQCKYVCYIHINYITVIAVKRAITPLNKITLAL